MKNLNVHDKQHSNIAPIALEESGNRFQKQYLFLNTFPKWS